jgi:hypothetical protein
MRRGEEAKHQRQRDCERIQELNELNNALTMKEELFKMEIEAK